MKKYYIAALCVAFAAGAAWGRWGPDNRVDALKAAADSIAAAAVARDSAALRVADSLRAYADSIANARAPVIVVVRRDSAAAARADAAVAAARTARDSNVALVAAVRARDGALAGMRALAVLDSLTIAAERARGDSLAVALRDQTAAVLDLNARLQSLDRRRPKWARVAMEVVKIGGAAYVGYEIGRGR